MQKLFVLAVSVVAMWGTIQNATADVLSLNFQKIADTDTFIPGLTDKFSGLTVPSLDGGNVAFLGYGNDLYSAIVTSTDLLRVVADTSTLIPGQPDDFTFFGLPSISGSHVAFHAYGIDGYEGIFTDVDGIRVVADVDDYVPMNGTIKYDFFGTFPKLDGDTVAFRGYSSPSDVQLNIGVYLATNAAQPDQQTDIVADTDTAIPGGPSDFTGFGFPSLDGTDVAFNAGGNAPGGFGGYKGIFSTVGGLHAVSESGDKIPGSTDEDHDEFVSYGPVTLDGGHVVFRADNGAGQQGIYGDLGGSLDVIADTNTIIPLGGSTVSHFTEFYDEPSLDGSNVAFVGYGPDGLQGIYLSIDGSLSKVVDTDDMILGKTPVTFYVGDRGLDGDQIAFLTIFDDGSQGIYTVSFELLATLAGDYNDDHVVDAADYTVWRDTLGQDISLPNETKTPGKVTAEDYDVWVTNFGNSFGSGSGSLAVPEPATVALWLVATPAFWATLLRRRRAGSKSGAGSE